MYVPPRFDLLEFDDTCLEHSGATRDVLSWQGRNEEPAAEVTLTWRSDYRKILVSTGYATDRSATRLREDALLGAWSGDALDLRARPASRDVWTRAQQVAEEDHWWSPMSVSGTARAPHQAEWARLDDLKAGYATWEGDYVLVAAVGVDLSEVALRTVGEERASTYIKHPLAPIRLMP